MENKQIKLIIVLTIINIVILILNSKDIFLEDDSKHQTYKLTDEFYEKHAEFFKDLEKLKESK